MFTGIVEELGTVVAITRQEQAMRLTVHAPVIGDGVVPGDSVSINGVCLTAVSVAGEQFVSDVMRESLDRSNLGALAVGDPVNVERAATLQTRLGGHLVQGHVDATGRIIRRTPAEHWHVVRITVPGSVARYTVEKGSITLDGVSLTISAIGPDWCEVSLIPTTLARTTFGSKEVGELVNIEVDVVAKYVERLLQGHTAPLEARS